MVSSGPATLDALRSFLREHRHQHGMGAPERTGLDERQISTLPTSLIQKLDDPDEEGSDTACCICLETYKIGDEVTVAYPLQLSLSHSLTHTLIYIYVPSLSLY